MKYTTETIHEKGKRSANEDNYLINEEKDFFLVCDGVGGAVMGAGASKLTVACFQHYFSKKEEINKEELKKAIVFTNKQFRLMVSKHPHLRGMATTLCFLHFNNGCGIIAHCGDSRVYHIRDGKILFQTKDHSYVQDLIDSGFISSDEAKFHPKKNLITRAIKGSLKLAQLDVNLIYDIRENDFFMLCTDGILEGLSEKHIIENFKNKIELTKIKEIIDIACLENSEDNYTAVLIKIVNKA